MTIRRQAPEAADYALLGGIHARAFAARGGAWSAAELRSLAAMNGSVLFIASQAADTTGFCLLNGFDGHYDLLTLAVEPLLRHYGIGRCLIEHSIAALRQDNATHITLEVAAGNAAARSLYTATGFRHIATRHGYYRYHGMVDDALVMQLLIK